MSIEAIFVLLLLVGGVAFWAHHGRIGVKAAATARRYVEEQNLQFLDQSVVLKGVRLSWRTSRGPCLKRTYEFEFTHRGEHRYIGSMTLSGWQVEKISLPPIIETAALH